MIIKPLPNDEHLFELRSIIICEICGGDSLLREDPRYDSTTEKYRDEKCLNDKCRYYKFDCGTLRNEEYNFFGEPNEYKDNPESSGFHTPEEWKDLLEYIGYRKCEKCGKVNSTLVESDNYGRFFEDPEKGKNELLWELQTCKEMDFSDKTFKKSLRELEVDLKNSQTNLKNCKDEEIRIQYGILIEGYEKELKGCKLFHEFSKKRTEDRITQIEEKIKMLETKEESPYYCDECEMDPHHIIQDSLF